MHNSFKTYFWIIVAVAIAAGFFIGGFYFGTIQGKKVGTAAVTAKFQPIIDYTYPKPPADIYQLTGTITNIYGAQLSLKVRNPDDYLPHVDGSPFLTQVRTVMISSKTQIVKIDMTKLDQNGNATRTQIQLSDLKKGDRVTVYSAENIHTAQQFDASGIELVQY